MVLDQVATAKLHGLLYHTDCMSLAMIDGRTMNG